MVIKKATKRKYGENERATHEVTNRRWMNLDTEMESTWNYKYSLITSLRDTLRKISRQNDGRKIFLFFFSDRLFIGLCGLDLSLYQQGHKGPDRHIRTMGQKGVA